jgi:hypothetical protein
MRQLQLRLRVLSVRRYSSFCSQRTPQSSKRVMMLSRLRLLMLTSLPLA